MGFPLYVHRVAACREAAERSEVPRPGYGGKPWFPSVRVATRPEASGERRYDLRRPNGVTFDACADANDSRSNAVASASASGALKW